MLLTIKTSHISPDSDERTPSADPLASNKAPPTKVATADPATSQMQRQMQQARPATYTMATPNPHYHPAAHIHASTYAQSTSAYIRPPWYHPGYIYSPYNYGNAAYAMQYNSPHHHYGPPLASILSQMPSTAAYSYPAWTAHRASSLHSVQPAMSTTASTLVPASTAPPTASMGPRAPVVNNFAPSRPTPTPPPTAPRDTAVPSCPSTPIAHHEPTNVLRSPPTPREQPKRQRRSSWVPVRPK